MKTAVTISAEQLATMDPALRAQVEALQAAANVATGAASASNIKFKIGEKGAVSVYGLTARFPVTLYAGQAVRFLHAVPAMVAFMKENRDKLSVKEGEQIDAILAALPTWIPGNEPKGEVE